MIPDISTNTDTEQGTNKRMTALFAYFCNLRGRFAITPKGDGRELRINYNPATQLIDRLTEDEIYPSKQDKTANR